MCVRERERVGVCVFVCCKNILNLRVPFCQIPNRYQVVAVYIQETIVISCYLAQCQTWGSVTLKHKINLINSTSIYNNVLKGLDINAGSGTETLCRCAFTFTV